MLWGLTLLYRRLPSVLYHHISTGRHNDDGSKALWEHLDGLVWNYIEDRGYCFEKPFQYHIIRPINQLQLNQIIECYVLIGRPNESNKSSSPDSLKFSLV